MKSRILYPSLWADSRIQNITRLSKYLFNYLVNNPFLGLTRYSNISDKQIQFDTELNKDELQKCKDEIQTQSLIFFCNNWQYHNHGLAYMDYEGRDRVVSAKEKELEQIPLTIKDLFKGLVTGYEPVLNPKPEIINHKSNIVDEKSLSGGIEYCRSVPEEDIGEFTAYYKVSREQVITTAEKIIGHCESKGKRYKDYRATLTNWLLTDFGKRPQKKMEINYELEDPYQYKVELMERKKHL